MQSNMNICGFSKRKETVYGRQNRKSFEMSKKRCERMYKLMFKKCLQIEKRHQQNM